MKKKTTISEILLYIYLTGAVLFIFLGPVVQRVGGVGYGSKQKSCYSNLRIIQGAVEMYNMDVKTMMNRLDQRPLREGKYLKATEDIVCPDKEIGGTYSGDNLTETGEIICSYHGGLIIAGPYDGDSHIKKSKKQIEYERKKYTSDCLNRIPYALFWPFFSYPDALTTYCK